MANRKAAFFATALFSLALGASPALGGWKWDNGQGGGGGGNGNGNAEEYDEAEIFFELNNTDGDLGIHALIDGEDWRSLSIRDKKKKKLLDILVAGSLRRQGLTEIFFESAEPNFDDLDPEEFFDRFPPGTYRISGKTTEGGKLKSETEITHVIPAGPVFTINGIPARPLDDSDCDEENPTEISNPIVIRWNAVTESHPDLGEEDADIEIIKYEAVAEWEDEEEQVFTSNVLIQPDGSASYEVTVSPEFFVDGTEVKFEVLAREESFNQTATESCPFEFVD